ncbi:LacI family DNA-binding transcriptional regulator [Winogradskyella flava]|uniref:LacI family DNA-binding transcriptional regulator n=1 Tax=Winogradskyella flava TaxID=1884876 RepID=A0A842IMG2_9FLAO|nr:LacI family DNA-binding transcriptional regulator [Winogradskyella flava]MBC2844140.1 LacI family DNA-binding transcriptional regulator [Winogradskyella flava]
MKSAAVTIKELSCLSGYSISTVSKAMNNKKDISLETRKAIRNIAKQHNYIPNNYAVSLRSKTSKSIAIIVPKVTERCFNQALDSLQKKAEIENYRILFYQSFGNKSREKNYINSLNDGSVHGIIVISKEPRTKNYSNYSMPVQALNIEEYHSIEEISKRAEQSLTRLLAL